MPLLAALIAASAFDIACHDAFGVLHEIDIYKTYTSEYLTHDLSEFLSPQDEDVCFKGRYPGDYLDPNPPTTLPVWHLVGGLDPIEQSDCSGSEPNDGYPITLRDWITSDGLKCLKIKLRGNDTKWDYDRIERIGDLSIELEVEHLSVDFNCTVTDLSLIHI